MPIYSHSRLSCFEQCPQKYKLQEKPANEYLNDTGLQLVNSYTDLKTQKKTLTDELNTLIKQAGIWDDVSELDIYALTHTLDKHEWPPELTEQIHTYQNTKKNPPNLPQLTIKNQDLNYPFLL